MYSEVVGFKNLHLPDEVFHTRIARAETFLLKLLAENNNAHVKGPYLAKLEIERTKLAYRKGDVSKLVDELGQYYSRARSLSNPNVREVFQESSIIERLGCTREYAW